MIIQSLKLVKHKKYKKFFCQPISKYNKKGFTLIELIISIVILAVFLLIITYFALDVIGGKVKSQSMQETQQNARFVIKKMTQEIKRAIGINIDQSIFGTHPGVLSLKMADENENPTVFDISGDKLRITRGFDSPQELTTNQVKVINLVFTNLSQTGSSENIKINLTVEHINPEGREEMTAVVNLETTVTLRQ